MNFLFPKWNRFLAVALAAGAVMSIHAQATMRHGAAISFSSPDNEEMISNMPSLTPQPPALPEFPGAVQSPSLNLNSTLSPPLPPPPRMLSPQEIQKLDEKKNWALMTPEEILGVQTPEQILGISERDAADQPKSETVTERYLERQERNGNPTNLFVRYDATQWNLPERETNSGAARGAFGFINPSGNSFFQDMLPGTPAKNQNAGNSWPGSFGLPPPPSPQTLTAEQIAANEAFQKLIEMRSPPPEQNSSDKNFFNAPTQPDTLLIRPPSNPLGASFTPISGNVGQPIAVKPLPKLIQKPDSTTPIAPEWTPQQPPWMSTAPEPGVIPQRKF